MIGTSERGAVTWRARREEKLLKHKVENAEAVI